MLVLGEAVVLVTLTLTSAAPGKASSVRSDQDEVLRLEQEFIAAWNRGDAKAAAAYYAEDGVRVGAFGDVSRGRAEIEAAYAKLLGGPMQGATASWQPT